MKLIKTRLRNLTGERILSNLVKTEIGSPEKLSGNDLDNIINIIVK